MVAVRLPCVTLTVYHMKSPTGNSHSTLHTSFILMAFAKQHMTHTGGDLFNVTKGERHVLDTFKDCFLNSVFLNCHFK